MATDLFCATAGRVSRIFHGANLTTHLLVVCFLTHNLHLKEGGKVAG